MFWNTLWERIEAFIRWSIVSLFSSILVLVAIIYFLALSHCSNTHLRPDCGVNPDIEHTHKLWNKIHQDIQLSVGNSSVKNETPKKVLSRKEASKLRLYLSRKYALQIPVETETFILTTEDWAGYVFLHAVGDSIPLEESDLYQNILFLFVISNGISPSGITPDSSIIDSFQLTELDQVEMIMELDCNFNIEIPDDDAEKLVTLRKIHAYIANYGMIYSYSSVTDYRKYDDLKYLEWIAEQVSVPVRMINFETNFQRDLQVSKHQIARMINHRLDLKYRDNYHPKVNADAVRLNSIQTVAEFRNYVKTLTIQTEEIRDRIYQEHPSE